MKRATLKQLQKDESGRAALAACAILPDPVELPLLGALCVSPEVMDLIFDVGVLEPDSPLTARWSGILKRDEVLEQLAWSERRRLHERLAALLAAKPERLADAAQHYLAACRYAEARVLMIRHAESACADKQYDRALAVLDQCLSLWPADEDREKRLHMLGEMVRCARNCSRHDLAKRALLETLDMVGETDAGITAKTRHQLADLALMDEDFTGARRHLEAAAVIAEKDKPGLDSARHWFALASFLADQMRPHDGLLAIQRARKVAGVPCDVAFDSELLAFEGLLCAMSGQAAAAHDFVQRALELAMAHQLKREAAIAYRRMANIREYDSDYAGEREAHLHAIALCRKQDETESEQSCLACLSYVFFRTGEWKRALSTTKDVMADPGTHPALKAGALGVQSMIAAFRGENRQALAGMEEARLGMRRYGVLVLEFHLLWARAFALEAEGDQDGAASTYLRMLDLWEDTDDRHDVAPGAVSAAAFFNDAGDHRQMARITDLLHKVVTDNDNEENRAARSAVLAETSASGKDWKIAIARLSDARDGYDRLGVPIERALIRRRLSRIMIAAGKEREAAEARESCAGIARSLGMRTLLASLDVASKRSKQQRDAALTDRQHDVLRLLAAGLTNKEAASRLHLSPRTVEMHVASLLDRLNCRTRAAAIRRAGELGLLE
jgi:DNA-binding CsgD family transcriptional regulator/tetratricopeptide (TPR) repeat protein